MAMPIAAPRYTVDDLDAFPDDGQHYELLDGVLLVSPAPALQHQVIVQRLATALSSSLTSGAGMVVSPGRIQRGRSLSLEPDVLVFPAPSSLSAAWTDVSTWWLAVEVLSPSTRVYDTEWKRPAYQAMGVLEVWLVDPVESLVRTWLGADPAPRVVSDRLAWRPEHVPGLSMDLEVAALFR